MQTMLLEFYPLLASELAEEREKKKTRKEKEKERERHTQGQSGLCFISSVARCVTLQYEHACSSVRWVESDDGDGDGDDSVQLRHSVD
jgi:hypothetical protein